jgi:hypothetical protein
MRAAPHSAYPDLISVDLVLQEIRNFGESFVAVK